MVKFIGKINRKKVNELYGSARAGICIYQPAENHYEAQPIKMFEFMAAGLPVIVSDFPLWKKIVEEAQCGICVNPQNAEEVREACKKFLLDTSSAQAMGQNGREAVSQQYNWDVEENKLVELYSLLGEK